MKPCSKCGETKAASEFHMDARRRDGLSYNCKVCCKAAAAKHYLANSEKERAAAAKRRAANPEKVKANRAKWNAANPEKVKAYNAKWYAENPDKALKSDVTWRAAHPEKAKAYSAKYYAANPEKHNAKAAKRRATKLNATPAWADLNTIKAIYAGCPEGHHVDHFYPLKGKSVCGLHVAANLQYLTSVENLSKGSKHPDVYVQQEGF